MKRILLIAVLLTSAIFARGQHNDKGNATAALQDTTTVELEPVDEPAEYPGGMEAFTTYISRKVKYPKQAQADHINGKVLVSFVVEKDGTLGDVKIIKSLTKETDAEAIRLIKASKAWKPAKIGSSAARQRFTQAISFSPPED